MERIPAFATSSRRPSGANVNVSQHLPVMVGEALRFLEPQRGGTYVDCTVGLGGHTKALLDGGADRVIGIDRDPQALAAAAEALAGYGERVRLTHADYRDLDAVLDRQGVSESAGTLADLGVSSLQFDAPGPRLQLPPRRAARHADGPDAGRNRRRAPGRRRRDRARRRDLRVRRGAQVAAHRPGDRRRARAARRSRPPDSWRRSSGGPPAAPAGSASTRRRAPSRRCGSG